MKKLFYIATILASAGFFFGSSVLAGDVGVSFVQEGGDEKIAEMNGTLSDNNLSCAEKQECQKKFDKVHDAAKGNFSGTITGELVDAETGEKLTAEFSIGLLDILGKEYRVIYAQGDSSVNVVWVDPAANVSADLPIPEVGE